MKYWLLDLDVKDMLWEIFQVRKGGSSLKEL